MNSPRELDVFNCALDGISQIEASAGTGKTWNICALYVRLLLEKRLSAEQILVVTFTKAATAELHERIRDRLSGVIQVLDALLDHADEFAEAEAEAADADADADSLARTIVDELTGGDPFVIRLLETTVGNAPHHAISLADARLRLLHAVRGFDQAAIHTIHAFCQRALQQAPFAAGMPFEFELANDDRALRADVAMQFWRTRVEPVAEREPGFAAWLVDLRASPESLDIHLVRRLKKPLARLIWSDVSDGESGNAVDVARGGTLERAFTDAYATAATIWQSQHETLLNVLERAQPQLKQNSHKPELVRGAYDSWAQYFAAGRVQAPPANAARIGHNGMIKGLKKGAELPEHPFFAAADAVLDAAQALGQWHEHLWLGLVRQWLEWAPAALHEMKLTSGTVSFDDLLSDLHRALTRHEWLAAAIRQRYAAALIDEFQDTDPLQFDIFTRVFAPAGETPSPLFLVGDPKQAIYSFRAADLHTYLAARERATARYTLAVNQRSTEPMISACNQVFATNPAAFILPGLSYEPVRAGTRERPPLRDDDDVAGADVGLTRPALRIWRLPGADAVLRKREAQTRIAHACAAEIVRLLNGGRDARVLLGETALAPGDIAVLVQTKKQGGLIKRVLAEWGVGSVELTQASVFTSADAACLERLLQAIDTPGDPRRMRAALATDWIGLDAQHLWALDHAERADGANTDAADATGATDATDVTDATSWVERFSRYRLLWNERGFATMWRTLLHELKVQQRLALQPEGERRLTNLAHLGELAQTQAATQSGLAPLLRWLASERNEPGLGEEAQLRMESDRNLVQIVTVHKSKGLEYPIVFCPFLNDNAQRPSSAGKLPDAREYRDADGAVLHYGCDADTVALARDQAAIEQAAERARLTYVALTRAVYRCYLVSGPYASGSTGSTTESRKSVLEWLVAGRGDSFANWQAKPPEETELAQAWQALASPAIGLLPLPAARIAQPMEALDHRDARFAARVARRGLRDSWRIASFSALAASGTANARHFGQDAQAAHDLAGLRPDHDALAGLRLPGSPVATLSIGELGVTFDAFDDFDDNYLYAPEPAEPMPIARGNDDIIDFPRGSAAGECLHRMFELADFNEPLTWAPAVERALRERPAPAGAQLAPRLPAMMNRLLSDVVSTRLAGPEAPHLTLAQVAPAKRLTELEFSFPAKAVNLAALAELLRVYGYGVLPELAFNGGWLDGYLKGFIDLVFEYDERFWVLDWKSNFLGEHPGDYGPAQLTAAMQDHLYTLQALIYVLALHRYLRHRLPDYDYQRHVGGSLYLFVRAVRPDWRVDGLPAGVWCDRPPLEMIEALDRLMQGGGNG